MKMKNGSYSFEGGEPSAEDRAVYESRGYTITVEENMDMREVMAKYLNLKFDANGKHVDHLA